MRETYLLQDWTTVSTASINTDLTQASEKWLDLGFASDVTFITQVLSGTSNVFLRLQTAPLRSESLFRQLVEFEVETPGLTTSHVRLYDDPSVPLARWTRWQIHPNDFIAMGIVFRITVMAYPR